MATIVNARDVLLQAASPRFLGVQVGSNIQVPIANVPGLSTALDGTKEVQLQGTSQVYQIPKSGSTTPSSITVTAFLKNLSGTPSLTLTNGTMSVTPALTGGVFTFTPAQMTSDSITLHLSLTVGATTYTDDWTVVKVREGADGVTGFLTNESFILAADTAGNVTTYTGANGNFKVFQGTTDVTTACTFSVPTGGNPNSLTYSLTASGSGAGTYSVSGGFGTGVDQTTLTIRATFGSMTIDKIFSLSKSKAGSNGTSGSNGTNGARGSQTFYVAISGTSFSDSTATTTASVNGGPIYGDVVTQYDNSNNFALSKFWNGSGWTTINAVVDGNLLVQGTVGAQKLIVNNGSGNNLWWDANFQQPSQWALATSGWGTLPTLTTVSDGAAGGYVARSQTATGSTSGGNAYILNRVPVTVGKQYRISVKARKSTSGDNGLLYLRIDPNAAQTGNYNNGITSLGLEAVAITTSWATYSAVWTATQPYVGLMVLVNYDNTGSSGYSEWQDLRVEELMDSALIVTGGITADRLDTRGLSVKDTNGNVILSANTALGNDSATSLGFNPTFSAWTSTLPDGWGSGVGGSPTRETSIVLGSPFSVRWTVSSDTGMQRMFTFPSPLPAGTFITGSFSMYMVGNNGGGKPGYLVRLFTNSAITTYVDTVFTITDQTVSGWQKMAFTATANGSAIYAIQIYQMASWSGMPGGNLANGSVVLFGPMSFEVNNKIDSAVITPASGWLNSNISMTISSGGVLSATGGPSVSGTVTLSGLGAGAMATINQITSSNVSTYIASAAINLANINVASIGTLSALSSYLGTVEIATGGYLRSGQTAWSTGSGFWLGWVGSGPGEAGFSIGDSGAYLRYKPSTGLELKLNTFSYSLNTSTTVSVSGNGSKSLGVVTATVSGGVSPYTYAWTVLSQSDQTPEKYTAWRNTAGSSANTCDLYASSAALSSFGNTQYLTVSCTVTDANGRVASLTSGGGTNVYWNGGTP